MPCVLSAERNWSVYGKIKTAEFSRMGHEVADKRKSIYCHEVLHLKDKLQSAGYKQAETVSWDTNEASDASATEVTWLYSAARVRA